MIERHSVAREREHLALLPLWEAAVLALERIFPGEDRHPRLLHTLALALSELMPVYARSVESGELRQLSAREIAGERLARTLAVDLRDLDEAIAALRPHAADARASLTLRQSPKTGSRR